MALSITLPDYGIGLVRRVAPEVADDAIQRDAVLPVDSLGLAHHHSNAKNKMVFWLKVLKTLSKLRVPFDYFDTDYYFADGPHWVHYRPGYDNNRPLVNPLPTLNLDEVRLCLASLRGEVVDKKQHFDQLSEVLEGCLFEPVRDYFERIGVEHAAQIKVYAYAAADLLLDQK